MELTILIVITMLGLMMPLFWIIGTVTGGVYFFLHTRKERAGERTIALDPQLGLTMADGGDSIDKEGKK
ncbi:MAG: hypothetical protein HY742_03420 [Deltaproteobacteria bacterium]|nr:hypothetical protein [Deltaproteobacteria bacterium]